MPPVRSQQTPRRLRAMPRVAAALLLLLTGCRSESTPAPPPAPPTVQKPSWPEKLADMRFRWSAEPGTDLATGRAVLLRAYLESWLITLYTGDLEAGFPGFHRATPESVKRTSSDWLSTPLAQREIGGYAGKPFFEDPDQRFVGNEDLNILRLEPMEAGFRAFVCDATYGLYLYGAGSTRYTPIYYDASVSTNEPDIHNMSVWRIEFTDRAPSAVGAPTPAPAAPQEGPLPAPRTDVFGPWFVAGAQKVSFWVESDYPGLRQPELSQRTDEAIAAEGKMRQQCLDRYPLDAEQRAQRATTVLDHRPPVEPAVPGWSDAE